MVERRPFHRPGVAEGVELAVLPARVDVRRQVGERLVDRPWQAFACAVIGGAGVGVTRTANQTLLTNAKPA
jgi:hypothetical protein